MTEDIIRKRLLPKDREWLDVWLSEHGEALAELAQYFCRFPGNVEVSCTLKMSVVGDEAVIRFGDVTAPAADVRKAFASKNN